MTTNQTKINNHFLPQLHKLSLWQKSLVVCISIAGLIVGSTLWPAFFAKKPLLSPLSESSAFSFLPETVEGTQTQRVVYGFLPYWNLSKVTFQPELTHIGYFGLTIGSDGSLLSRTVEGPEPGYSKLQSAEFLELVAYSKEHTKKLELVVTQFSNDDIVSFLSNKQAHQTFIDSLDSVLLAYPFSGVNIDIEYSGEVTPKLRSDLVLFMATLKTHLTKTYKSVPVTIDLYASGAKPGSFWDVAALEPHVDAFIIMAYDFHRRSSPVAGPVAPLFGGKTVWDHDISQHLQEFIKLVPRKKLWLGVPFYGYEWQTTTINPQAFTLPGTGSTASYERIQKLLSQSEALSVTQGWSEEALSPYLTYKEDGELFVVYYENSRSMSYKYDFVNQLDLGGIAIWALGYEGSYRELWDVIARKLR